MSSVSFWAGIATTTFLASGLFFLKFWKASSDRFFLYFALSCFMLGIERVLLFALLPPTIVNYSPPEAQAWVYLVRMAAYILILYAVIQRNRARS